MLSSVPEPTGAELAQSFRLRFPEMNLATFDVDVDSMTGSRCGTLIAFSWQFREWVQRGNEEVIKRALALVDQLLSESPPVPSGTHALAVGDQFHNSLLACFVENIVDRTKEFRALVLSNLGPEVRSHLAQHDPHSLGHS